jgi:hypothetical protein
MGARAGGEAWDCGGRMQTRVASSVRASSSARGEARSTRGGRASAGRQSVDKTERGDALALVCLLRKGWRAGRGRRPRIAREVRFANPAHSTRPGPLCDESQTYAARGLEWLAAGPLGATSTSSARRRAHEGRPAWPGRPGRGFAIECLTFLLELHHLLALQACPAGAFCGAAAQSGLDAERGDAERLARSAWARRIG